jgi:hypothetical protein
MRLSISAPHTVTPRIIEPGGSASKSGTISLNAGQKEYVDLAVKATSPAHTNSGQIDWNWVEDVFHGHSVSKNGFGAGWWARKGNWSQFTHLSSNDKKGIIDWAKTHAGPDPKRVADNLVERKAPKPCTGESLVCQVNDGTIWNYLNSCGTDLMIARARAKAALNAESPPSCRDGGFC